MGPSKSGRPISQQAFDDLVRENIDDLGMDPSEALSDAIETLSLQGVDLTGIVTRVPGAEENPVVQCLDGLRRLDSDWSDRVSSEDGAFEGAVALLDELTELCRVAENVAVAARNGAVELACSICAKTRAGKAQSLVSALEALASVLHDVQSTNTFHKNDGEKLLMSILTDGSENINILSNGFSVVSAAATGNEIVKESFMDLKIDELILQVMRRHCKYSFQSLYDTICVLLNSDDNRVIASQVYGYARRFAKLGIAGDLVESLHKGISSPNLVSASLALKAVAVNDEICRSIAEKGGIGYVLQCIDDSGLQGNRTAARACCSLLSKLAGSDFNKNEIVEKGGLNNFIILSSRFSDDPSILQEVMSIICSLSLRSPERAALAVEAGAGDLAIQYMTKYPMAHKLQRNSCLMIRNLVVRNPENRTLLLNNCVEKIIRKAKESHESCKDAAVAALRDLGLDYNS